MRLTRIAVVVFLFAGISAAFDGFAAAVETQQPTVTRSRPLVKEVQIALQDQGFDPGSVDGIMGPRTREALRKFQAANGLVADGQITDETLEKLGVDAPEGAGSDSRDRGLLGSAASAIASGAKTAAAATATGAKAAANATATGAQAAGEGAATGGKVVAKGATVAAGATVSGAETAGEATAKGATTGGKATASAAKTAASGVGKAYGGTKNFLFGKDLADKVRDAFKRNGRINLDHVDVDAEESTVTLTFKGGSSAEWNRAVAVAKRVDGVERVFVRTP